VGDESIYIRGAYFVGSSTGKNKFIDFFIVDPAGKVIYSKRKSEEGIFRFNTTIPGTYAFVFSNMKVIAYIFLLKRV
jgi:emp24/gp25L/p24 family/GOLD